MEESIGFVAIVPREGEARAIANDVVEGGGEAIVDVPAQKGLLPVAVLLAIVIPPGLALLAKTVNDIVHSWKDHGTVIDATGDGDPKIKGGGDLPYGTVVVITKDGESAERSDLEGELAGDYIAKVLKALKGGASAEQAMAAAGSEE
jgi:hypothetical protein